MTAIKFNSHTQWLAPADCNNHQAAIAAQVEDFVSFRLENLYAPLNVLESLEVSRATRLMAMLMCYCDTGGGREEGALLDRAGVATVVSMLDMANLCRL